MYVPTLFLVNVDAVIIGIVISVFLRYILTRKMHENKNAPQKGFKPIVHECKDQGPEMSLGD